MAIDIGASSGRHIVGWLESGQLKNGRNIPLSERSGQRRRSPNLESAKTVYEVVNGLKAAKQTGKIPSYTGIDTRAVDYAPLGKDGKQTGEMFAYRDDRM